MVNFKDVENYLTMPKVKQPKQEDDSLNNLVRFVLWMQDNHIQIGQENCEHGYMVFEDLDEKYIKKMAKRYLKEFNK